MTEAVLVERKPITLTNPISDTKVKEISLAPRLNTLQGKVIGILDNAKPRADVMLEECIKYLEAKGAICSTIREFKPHLAKPMPMEQIEKLAKADAVIGAIGD